MQENTHSTFRNSFDSKLAGAEFNWVRNRLDADLKIIVDNDNVRNMLNTFLSTVFTKEDFMFILNRGENTDYAKLEEAYKHYIRMFVIFINTNSIESKLIYGNKYTYVQISLTTTPVSENNTNLSVLFFKISTTINALTNTYNNFDVDELYPALNDDNSKLVAHKNTATLSMEFNNTLGLL